MSQHRTIALSADKLVRTCFCHLGWCRDRFHLVPLLASASVPRRLSRAGTSFTLQYNNVFECYALRGTFIKCKNAKSEGICEMTLFQETKQDFHTFAFLLICWTLCTGKLSFQYPESLGTDFSRPFSWPPSVKLVRASTCQCDTVINGQRYCIEQWSEGSAGHIEMTYTYLTELPKHKVAVSVAVMVRTPQCMNYDEPQQSRCITERDSFDLNQLIHALSILTTIIIANKNGNSLWVEHAVLTYQRMWKEVVSCPAFARSPATSATLRDEFISLYNLHCLEQFGRLNRKRSKIHCAIIFPKDKSPIEKTRFVCNQKRSPWRNVLRNLSRILQFINLKLDGVLLHFNLPDLSKLQLHLTRATTRFRDFNNNSRVSVFQFDIKQMFTWLSHESVIHSLLFALTAMKLYTRESKRSATYCDAFQVSKQAWMGDDNKLRFEVDDLLLMTALPSSSPNG
eukprot:g50264.t1